MKILVITRDFVPNPGGIAVFLHNLCEQLTFQGHRVDVLAPAVENIRTDGVYSASYQVHRFAQWRRLGSVPAIWLALCLHLQHCYDLVFVGHVMSSRALGALVLNKLWRVPYVVLSHGNDLSYSVKTQADKRIVDLVMENATLLLGNSSFTAERIRQAGYKGPLQVLNPGVDPARFHPGVDIGRVRQQYGLDGHRVLLTTARLVAKKNVDGVLRALSKVIGQVPDVLYLVVGEGEQREQLEALCSELGLCCYVHLLGYVENSQLPALYCASDLFVMPTKSVESFGISFLEANACGKPVIGGWSGGTADAIVDGETGLLVDPHNVDEIAAAIVRLLTDRELARQLGKNGRQRVEQELSWEKVGERLVGLLQGVIRDTGTGG